jgi:hypothetical protein
MVHFLRIRAAATLLGAACLVVSSAAAPRGTPAVPSGLRPAAAQAPRDIRQLGGVDELKAWFNDNAAHPRAIFLLSPT